MFPTRSAFIWFVVCVWAVASRADEIGIRAPDGFEVTLFAGDELAHDIFSMTIDSHGRVVVAGRDYVKILHDDDGDGRADRTTLFSDVPKSGAHGMVFDGDDLICTGDNALMRLRDADGDGRADGPPEIWTPLRHSEHGANGIVQGPDGWFYVICGNDAGVSRQHAATPLSPVQQPQCGAVVRFSPDGRQSEIVAHGFRNPYDLDFNDFGNLFTVDADGERDQYLPWYSPTRLFDISQGMHHGWIQHGWRRSWNRPEYFFDNVDRLVEVGRGSPTGVLVYRHQQFPSSYRGSVFSCCWTLGRVYRFPLERHGSSYRSRREIFLETTGEVGFAPVDLAVAPSGDLLVAIGGRRTRGSVFRVRYTGRPSQPQPSQSPLLEVVSADQPLTAWSRRRWALLARRLGSQPFEAAVVDRNLSTRQRIRALEVLVEMFDGVAPAVVNQIAAEGNTELAARAAWALSRRPPTADSTSALIRLTHHRDAPVARAAWEALALSGPLGAKRDDAAWSAAAWSAVADRSDRRVRSAAILADGRLRTDVGPSVEPGLEMRMAALRRSMQRGRLGPGELAIAKDLFLATRDVDQRLEAVRLMQIALGDVSVEPMQVEVYAGYIARAPLEAGKADHLGRALAGAFPSGDNDLDRELARLLGMLGFGDASTLRRMSGKWSAGSSVQDDVHYLIVLSLLPGLRSDEVTAATAAALARLHYKMASRRLYASRNWPLRVGETFEQLCRRDPNLPQALIDQPAFGLPAHSMFAASMTGLVQQSAARKLLRSAQDGDDQQRWTGQLVEVVATLPADESLPALRGQWDDYTLRDAIVAALMRDPKQEDRQRLIDALQSAQPNIVEGAANALRTLGGEPSTEAVSTALRRLRQFCAEKKYINARRALSALLSVWTGQQIAIMEPSDVDPATAYRSWFEWFERAHPEAAASLSGFASADAAAWKARLASISWSEGMAARGKLAFERRACQRCHGGTDRLGPDLAGAARRLSRSDLFAAIVDPNQDVSPLYQTSRVITASGKVYHGLIVYESPEGTLVQTTPDETVRVAGAEIVAIQSSRQSLMPAGLLGDATDGELADLYAYLKTLRGK